MLHAATTAVRAAAPTSFEPGTGERRLAKWFWPMGGEMSNGQLFVFWAEMEKDGYEPRAGDGLGWHPKRTWLAVYDPATLARLSFQPAPNPVVYADLRLRGRRATASTRTCSATRSSRTSLGRAASATARTRARRCTSPVCRGASSAAGPSTAPATSGRPTRRRRTPIVQRYWAENPMQPRFVAGQWVAATKVDGYWGERLAIDVANEPWGPWTTVAIARLSPRNGDPLMNTYHAHLLPWLDGGHARRQHLPERAEHACATRGRTRTATGSRSSHAALVAPPPERSPEETTTTVEEATDDVDRRPRRRRRRTTTTITCRAAGLDVDDDDRRHAAADHDDHADDGAADSDDDLGDCADDLGDSADHHCGAADHLDARRPRPRRCRRRPRRLHRRPTRLRRRRRRPSTLRRRRDPWRPSVHASCEWSRSPPFRRPARQPDARPARRADLRLRRSQPVATPSFPTGADVSTVRIAYGDDASQFGELTVPTGTAAGGRLPCRRARPRRVLAGRSTGST